MITILRKITKLTLVILLTLLLCACGQKVEYQHGFPEEPSPALNRFIQYNLTGGLDREILNKNSTLVFTDRNGNEKQTSITYYQFTEKQLEAYYEPLFEAKEPNRMLYDLKQTDRIAQLHSSVENIDQYSLPSVMMQDNNQLEIKIEDNQKTIELNEAMKDYGVTNTTEFIINVEAVNEGSMVITLEDIEKLGQAREKYYLFIDQGLSDFAITQLKYEEMQEIVDSNVLDSYSDIFPKEGEYRSLFNGISILNVETNKITNIQENDLLSEDGKFVYLNGAMEELSDGEQQIQTIANYAKGNNIYEAQFQLDFDKISKQLDFETNKISIANVNYFNEDYAVLNLLYKGKTIGDGGHTNVLVDLQNQETPIVYLVDLGIE